MFIVKKDLAQNRLYVTLRGILSITEAKEAMEMVQKEVKELKTNFDLINDISDFVRGQEEAGPILQETMKFLINQKVNRVVRVVGSSKVGLMQFANYSLPLESYKLKYVPTMLAAEDYLYRKKD